MRTRTPRAGPSPPPHGEQEPLASAGLGVGVPDVGEIIKRLRLQRGRSLREVAAASGVSVSFLSQVERGQSDIALGRLARIAQYFDHDVGSLLGYTARRAQPQFVRDDDRLSIDRGEGVRYEVLRLPGVAMEVILIEFAPRTAFRDTLTHEGIDIFLVTHGETVLSVNGIDYSMRSGDCAVWSAAYKHRIRNDSAQPAGGIAMVTESVY